MTVPVWPNTLLPPLRDGYQVGAGEGRRLSQEDSGPLRVARRFSAVADSVQMTLFLTRADLARFDRFYIEDTKRGSLPFWMPDFETDSWPLLTDGGSALLTDEGAPILLAETWLAMFGRGLPQRREDDLYFRVSFEIAVMP